MQPRTLVSSRLLPGTSVLVLREGVSSGRRGVGMEREATLPSLSSSHSHGGCSFPEIGGQRDLGFCISLHPEQVGTQPCTSREDAEREIPQEEEPRGL